MPMRKARFAECLPCVVTTKMRSFSRENICTYACVYIRQILDSSSDDYASQLSDIHYKPDICTYIRTYV